MPSLKKSQHVNKVVVSFVLLLVTNSPSHFSDLQWTATSVEPVKAFLRSYATDSFLNHKWVITTVSAVTAMATCYQGFKVEIAMRNCSCRGGLHTWSELQILSHSTSIIISTWSRFRLLMHILRSSTIWSLVVVVEGFTLCQILHVEKNIEDSHEKIIAL